MLSSKAGSKASATIFAEIRLATVPCSYFGKQRRERRTFAARTLPASTAGLEPGFSLATRNWLSGNHYPRGIPGGQRCFDRQFEQSETINSRKSRMKQKIEVDCRAGYRYPEKPVSLIIFGQRYSAQQIIQQSRRHDWATVTTSEYFQVRLTDSFVAEIAYQAADDCWYLLNIKEFCRWLQS